MRRQRSFSLEFKRQVVAGTRSHPACFAIGSGSTLGGSSTPAPPERLQDCLFPPDYLG